MADEPPAKRPRTAPAPGRVDTLHIGGEDSEGPFVLASGVVGGPNCADVFVADRGKRTVVKLVGGPRPAVVSEDEADAGATAAWARDQENSLPQMVALAKTDGEASGDLLMTDSRDCRVVRLDPATGALRGTLAGGGAPGGRDGPARKARFSGPWGVAAAPGAEGHVYVSEYFGCKIRRISKGIVTTVAGAGPRGGCADGIGHEATFAGPRGIQLSADAKTLFIADSGNHVVRALDVESGQVTTLCGLGGEKGFVDGPAKDARFAEPTALALDADGALYIADQENKRVRCLYGGAVTTLAGSGADARLDGVGVDASFSLPSSLHVCARSRRLFVGDRRHIRVIHLPPLREPVSPAVPTSPSTSPANPVRAVASAHVVGEATNCVWCGL